MTKTEFITEGTYSGDGRKNGSNCRWINLDEPLDIELGQRVKIKVIPLNDKETNPVKNSKIGKKVTIDGVEGYVLEVDDAGEPTVLCSEILGDLTWDDAMKKANQGLWHLPTEDEFKKYYDVVRELDGDEWNSYWTSTEYNSLRACFVYSYNGTVLGLPKTTSVYVRAFAYVGSKKTKIGNKVNIDGVEGYILEVDDAGEPTMLCSEILGEVSWYDATEKANQGLWHLPTVDEFKKYYEVIRELDNNTWHFYWTSTEYSSLLAHYVDTNNGTVNHYAKTYWDYVRAFAFVGKKRR